MCVISLPEAGVEGHPVWKCRATSTVTAKRGLRGSAVTAASPWLYLAALCLRGSEVRMQVCGQRAREGAEQAPGRRSPALPETGPSKKKLLSVTGLDSCLPGKPRRKRTSSELSQGAVRCRASVFYAGSPLLASH